MLEADPAKLGRLRQALCVNSMNDKNLVHDGWELESAQERHEEHPDKFEIPSKEEISNLQLGDMVKLLFLFWEYDKPEKGVVSCERMWVTIKTINGSSITGILENKPTTSETLEPLEVIEFGREHVCAVYIKKTDLRHPDYEK